MKSEMQTIVASIIAKHTESFVYFLTGNKLLMMICVGFLFFAFVFAWMEATMEKTNE